MSSGDEMTSLGERIRFLRTQVAQISQGELARRTGVRQATISNLEGGQTKGITLINAARLARELGVSLDNLMKGVDIDLMAATA